VTFRRQEPYPLFWSRDSAPQDAIENTVDFTVSRFFFNSPGADQDVENVVVSMSSGDSERGVGRSSFYFRSQFYELIDRRVVATF